MIEAELLINANTRKRGELMLRALACSATERGVLVKVTSSYSGKNKNLMLWGVGDIARNEIFLEHVKAGGDAYCWDMGYWHSRGGSDTSNSYNRFSKNHYHPQEIIKNLELDEQDKRRFKLDTSIIFRDVYNPNGPIILVGNGPKSCTHLKIGKGSWEFEALNKIRKHFGKNKKIIFRPKPNNEYERLSGTEVDQLSSIDDLMLGASLVVGRHSNVAVDAIRNGIPVSCEDGAASAVYNDSLDNVPITTQQAADFLAKLAWFHYSPVHAAAGFFWDFAIKYGVLK